MQRVVLSDETPEGGGMVHFLQMSELMNNDIINNLGRVMNESIVKVEVFIAGTRAPAGGCSFEADAAIFAS